MATCCPVPLAQKHQPSPRAARQRQCTAPRANLLPRPVQRPATATRRRAAAAVTVMSASE